MTKYQVKKYFSWGSLKLEPLQYLLVKESDYPDSYTVIQENSNEAIEVNKKSFQNYLTSGFIEKV
ncbi:MAG: hypothetical protein COY80_00685 [Candidatus Pacebacteria bacterium CG_4_10_14_0_8_um_filter_42_14]|nr:MAG: hypothetical protein COY80_00685 [Candidatus Pacebacteria bacterium CG_4_10_14_0_8_um_filter_42_14]